MTRFWITLDQGVEFVLQSFARTVGGEVFVPKIPSSRITDLAEAMAPGLPRRNVGIRPGEKLHEVMVPRDDARLTLEFARHYVIQPAITFYEHPAYGVDALGEKGRPVDPEFEYSSGENPEMLDVAALRALLERLGL